MLDKKLHELEMRFTDLFFPPANSSTPSINPSDQESISKEIGARVDFLKNLLTIEKESRQQGDVPPHLSKLEERLGGLDSAFRDWMDGGGFVKRDALGKMSMCSCTRSCFSEEGDEEEKERGEKEAQVGDVLEPESASDCFELGFEKDQRIPEVKSSDEGGNIEGDGKELRGVYRPCFRFAGRAVVFVGAAAMVAAGLTVGISELFGGYNNEVFLVPT